LGPDITDSVKRLSHIAKSSVWRRVLPLAGLAVVALAARALVGSGRAFGRSLSLLSHPSFGWVAVAAACELVSFLAYATAQRQLARAAGHRISVGWLASLAVSAQALNNFLPAGYVMANLFNFRQLRRRHLAAPVTGWLLLMSSVLYIGALALLALIGSEIPGGNEGVASSDLRLAALALLAALLLAVAGGLLLVRSREARRVVLAALDLLVRRVSQQPGTAEAVARRVLARLGEVRVSKRTVAAAGGLFVLGWVADAACLVSALLAIGATPPWNELLLAYCGAQLASFLPMTPGGLGVVEGTLALTLAGTGSGAAHVLAAVLLYRAISYWATLPSGAFGYLALRRSAALRRRTATVLA
jgi:uncharacterized membrane protein YbhN (UPF0104 family)